MHSHGKERVCVRERKRGEIVCVCVRDSKKQRREIEIESECVCECVCVCVSERESEKREVSSEPHASKSLTAKVLRRRECGLLSNTLFQLL